MDSRQAAPLSENRLLQALIVVWAAVWCVTAVQPVDRSDWLVENLLVFVLVPLLVTTHRRWPLSNLSYGLICVFLILHAIGAHYAYRPPIGDWLKEVLHLRRNHFDRLVHFSFGLLLTPPMREILAGAVTARGFWAWWLPISSVIALSGMFEVVEMIVAQMLDPELGATYLGIQGDEWDAQKDMGLAAIGAVLASLPAIRRSRPGSGPTPADFN
jgi:putative membrane protein